MNEDKPRDPVRAALHQAALTSYSITSSARLILRYENLNPEQRLAYAMNALLEQQKGVKALLEICNALAPEAVEWKKSQKPNPAKDEHEKTTQLASDTPAPTA